MLTLCVPCTKKVTSQHPYAEDFIGQPNVYTVDIDDLAEVERVVKAAVEAPNPQVHYCHSFFI